MTTLIFVKLIYSCITSAVFASNPVMIRVKTPKRKWKEVLKQENYHFTLHHLVPCIHMGLKTSKSNFQSQTRKKIKCCPYNPT